MCNCNKCKQQQPALLPEFETMLQESEYGGLGEFNYENEFETAYENEYEHEAEVRPRPTQLWAHNTNLKAPCPFGRFNFLYNTGAAEATVTFNTQVSYRQNFGNQAKIDFMNNLAEAARIWDRSAVIELLDKRGNYSTSIGLRFSVVPVTSTKSMNKRTDVFPPGAKATGSTNADQEAVDGELNVFIGSSAPVLVHELGHIWGLRDEYAYTKKKSLLEILTFRKASCHVGNSSPLVNDTTAIMNHGITLDGEFRTRYFTHFGRALLNSFWNMPDYVIPNKHNGRVVSKAVHGRIALLKKDMRAAAPYTSDQPHNPRFTRISVSRLP